MRLFALWLLVIAAPSQLEAVTGPRYPAVGEGEANRNTNDVLKSIVAVSGGNNDNNKNNQEVIHTHDIEIGKARAEFVRHILKDRLKYVRNGRRMADFHTWLRKRGGQLQVLSTHGVDVDMELVVVNEPTPQSTQQQKQPLQPPPEQKDTEIMTTTTTTTTSKQKEFHYEEDSPHGIQQVFTKNDPFAMNRLDLDLPVNNLPNLYEGKPIHLIDDLAPSLIQLFWRTIQLSLKFSPVLSTTWLAVLSTKFRKVWYKWVATSLGSTSAAFIKWGQWAATRNDMFPDQLCQELEQLQSSAPEHSWSFSEKMMESSLGLPQDSLMDVFDSFDQKPLASGSIAQVHKAYIDGRPVAVKIRHPRVAQLIDMDFRIMTAFARICDWIPALSWLHIRESVEQFSHTMAAQAHLQVEAHHLEILNHNFRKWPHVKFPYPIYASSAVIIETFEPGAIVSNMLDAYDALAQGENDKNNNNNNNPKSIMTVEEATNDSEAEDQDTPSIVASDLIPVDTAKFIVTTGLGLYLKMLLVDNLMHADLHPGNIMLAAIGKGDCVETGHDMDLLVVKEKSNNNQKDKKELDKLRAETTLRVCLVDAGMVAQLTENESSLFIGLLCSLGQGDGRLAAKFALQFSVENDLTPEQQEAFMDDMDALFKEKCNGYGTGVDVGEVLRGVLGLVRIHKVRIDANYATLVVNCLCIQSLALRVCAEYNVLDAAEPLLRSYFETFYEPDGTPKPRERAIQRFNRIMPVKYLQKSRNDDAFFRRIMKSRKSSKTK